MHSHPEYVRCVQEQMGRENGPKHPCCFHCGNECSGDVTEEISIDGLYGQFPICDEPDDCPANVE